MVAATLGNPFSFGRPRVRIGWGGFGGFGGYGGYGGYRGYGGRFGHHFG